MSYITFLDSDGPSTYQVTEADGVSADVLFQGLVPRFYTTMPTLL